MLSLVTAGVARRMEVADVLNVLPDGAGDVALPLLHAYLALFHLCAFTGDTCLELSGKPICPIVSQGLSTLEPLSVCQFANDRSEFSGSYSRGRWQRIPGLYAHDAGTVVGHVGTSLPRLVSSDERYTWVAQIIEEFEF